VLGRNPPLSVLRALSFREPQPAGSARYSNHSPNGQYRRNIIITIWVNQDHLAEERERERERDSFSPRNLSDRSRVASGRKVLACRPVTIVVVTCQLVARPIILLRARARASSAVEFNGFPRKGKWDALENGAEAKIGATDRTLPEYFTGRPTAVAKSVVIPGTPL